MLVLLTARSRVPPCCSTGTVHPAAGGNPRLPQTQGNNRSEGLGNTSSRDSSSHLLLKLLSPEHSAGGTPDPKGEPGTPQPCTRGPIKSRVTSHTASCHLVPVQTLRLPATPLTSPSTERETRPRSGPAGGNPKAPL